LAQIRCRAEKACPERSKRTARIASGARIQVQTPAEKIRNKALIKALSWSECGELMGNRIP